MLRSCKMIMHVMTINQSFNFHGNVGAESFPQLAIESNTLKEP